MAQNPYVVRIVVLQTGERLPMLCSRASGIPLHEPTLYALTELRARNRSSSTIQQALRSVMVLYLVFDGLKIDLGKRFQDGRLLDLGEIEQIVRHCHEPIDDMSVDVPEGGAASHPKVASLEKARMRSTAAMTQAEVDPTTAAIRIRYIREYLEWSTTSQLLMWGPKNDLYAGLKAALELVLRALDERVPGVSHRNTLEDRMGLTPEALARLLEVIEPTSPDNPWGPATPARRDRRGLLSALRRWTHRGTLLNADELLGIRIGWANRRFSLAEAHSGCARSGADKWQLRRRRTRGAAPRAARYGSHGCPGRRRPASARAGRAATGLQGREWCYGGLRTG